MTFAKVMVTGVLVLGVKRHIMIRLRRVRDCL